jgi:CRP/FNR family transcriptional regulator, polysaccharide utilization system transcription regulator
MNQTVLLIDDNAALLDNTAEILELANYKVIKASNGKEGMELALKSTPDIILCDILMPELDGYGVLRAIKNQPDIATVPFVFVTAKCETTDFRYGMDLGADDFLVKPYSGDQLLSIIAARIHKAQQVKVIKTNTSATGVANRKCVLPEVLAELLSGKFQVKKLRKKESLFLEGEDSNFLFQVTSGKLKTYKLNEAGKEYITNIYKTGDFFGFHALI